MAFKLLRPYCLDLFLVNALFVIWIGKTIANSRTDANVFERTNFTLFVTGDRSPNPMRNSSLECGQDRETACHDFIELMNNYCRLYGKLSYRNETASRPLTLHLLPGVHLVKISDELRRMSGSSRLQDVYVSRNCDFSTCAAEINLIGHSANDTIIHLTSEGNTSSSCGTVRPTPIDTDKIKRCGYGWIFLHFSRTMRLHVYNLTFKTDFAGETHTFFLLDRLAEFHLVRTRFSHLGTRVGALLIFLQENEKEPRSSYKIKDSQFSYTDDGHRQINGDYKRLSTAICVLKPHRSLMKQDDVGMPSKTAPPTVAVEVTGCTFHLRCRDVSVHRYPFSWSASIPSSFAISVAPETHDERVRLQLHIDDCSFRGSVYREGVCRINGSAVLLSYANTILSISNSRFSSLAGDRGSAVNVFGGKEIFIQHSHFESNGQSSTDSGGALAFGRWLYYSKHSPNVHLQDITFVNCSARRGAAIAADSDEYLRYRIRIQGVRVSYSESPDGGSVYASGFTDLRINDGDFLQNKGSAIALDGNGLIIGGNVTFVGNEGKNGGAITTLRTSNINVEKMASDIIFQNNLALEKGGAIYIDESSTEQKYCPILILQSEGKPGTERIRFSQNKALLYGDDLYIHTLRNCKDLSLQSKENFRRATGGKHDEHNLAIARTIPNYLRFNGADTVCIKPEGQSSWLVKDCKFSTIHLLYEASGARLETLKLFRQRFSNKSITEDFYGRGLPAFDLFKPWNSSMSPLIPGRMENGGSSRKLLAMAELCLLPSPGEVFAIHFTGLDQVLNKIPTTITLQVVPSATDGMTTPQLCIHQQCEDGEFTVSANRKLFGLSIEGPVGSEGFLQVRRITDKSSKSNVLSVPFRLSPCPVGFLPFGRQNTRQKCQCNVNSIVKSCSKGRKLHVKRGVWIGGFYAEWNINKSSTFGQESESIGHKTKFLMSADGEFVGVNLHLGKKHIYHSGYFPQSHMLIYGQCRMEYCDLGDLQKSANTVIDTGGKRLASSDIVPLSQCVKHREGLLCGKCQKGYSTTLYYKTCRLCKSANSTAVLSSTFTVGLLLFALLLFLNWTTDMMPSFLSLSFFGQMVTYVTHYHPGLPHGHEYISRSLNLDWSFGMCLTSNLNALQRLAWSFLAPAYLLGLVFLSVFVSRFRQLNRIFGRTACIKLSWQCLLLSYSKLTSISLQLLMCVHLSPKAVFQMANMSNWRFSDDASFECFAGDHLRWAIIAVSVILLISVTVPLSLPFLHHCQFFMPFRGISTSIYRDNRWWWCSVDLLRRLLFVAVYAANDNHKEKHLAMIQISVALLFIHTVFWPFKSLKANLIEAASLFFLSTICLLNEPGMNFTRSVATQCVFAVWVSFVLLDIVSQYVSSYLQRRNSIRQRPGFGLALSEKDDGTMLRENLLADPYPTDNGV